MGKWCFGIDLGGTTVKCALFQDNGTVVDKWEIVTRTENNGDAILPDIADTVLKKIAEKGIDKAEVVGLGIGVPGPVEESGEIPCAVNLHWGRKNIEKELGDMTGLSVKAGNDANVAALGEMWKGGGQGYSNLVAVTLGGEIGHANVGKGETEACNCGNKGCLEQYASATGIARLARMTMESETEASVLRSLKKVTAKDVFDAYKEGDKLAEKIVEKFASYLGNALAIFACVTDPDVFVIGGGVSKAGQPLIDCIEKHYKECAFPACKETPIKLATLGNDAGIYGAAKLILGK